MKSLKEIPDEHLTWIQPKAMHQLYELRIKEDIYGTLLFPKSVGSLAEAETNDGKWSFKRVGFFNTKITIRNFGEEKDIAVFKPNLIASTGILEFANGKSFHWHSSNFWQTKFEFKNAEEETVVIFRSGVEEAKLKDWFKTQARVEIPENKKNLDELSLLILLGWYLIIVLQMDSSAGAVVAVAS